MSEKIGIIQYGLGALGIMLVRAAVGREQLQFRGAIDVDPSKLGRDLGQIADLGKDLGVVVSGDAGSVLRDVDSPVVIHTTGTMLSQVFPQLEAALIAGKRVISSCEELAFPAYRYPELAEKLDSLAKKHGGLLVGTGVNPGFAMDLLPITLSSVVQDVRRVHVKRYQNASHRRLPFQKKIGAGMTVEQFRQKASEGAVRHAGLGESISLIAYHLGWVLDSITDDIEPVIAKETVTTPYMTVLPGQVAGCRQFGRGWKDGEEVITLEMSMYVGAPEEFDSTVIDANRRMELVVPGGIQGDVATISRLINTIPVVLQMQPGLYTVADLPAVAARLD